MNISQGTITRTAVLLLSLINMGLTVFGKNPLPWSSEEVENATAFVFVAVASLVSWWKNNSFTSPALLADKYLEQLRG